MSFATWRVREDAFQTTGEKMDGPAKKSVQNRNGNAHRLERGIARRVTRNGRRKWAIRLSSARWSLHACGARSCFPTCADDDGSSRRRERETEWKNREREGGRPTRSCCGAPVKWEHGWQRDDVEDEQHAHSTSEGTEGQGGADTRGGTGGAVTLTLGVSECERVFFHRDRGGVEHTE